MEGAIHKSDANYIENDNRNPYTPATVNLLSCGLLQIYKPSLNHVKEQLHELTEKQTMLIEQLHNENMKLSASQNCDQLKHMVNTIKVYQNKLVILKKEMKLLHEKSSNLKKRALRLQMFKEKDMYVKTQQKKNQLKKEQDLISKPSSSAHQK